MKTVLISNHDFFVFLGSFITGLLMAPLVLSLLTSLKSNQTISTYAPEGHQVKAGTPTMGGIIIVLAFLVVGLFDQVSWRELALVFGFGLIGFVDDFLVPRLFNKRGLEWKQKIVLQLLIATVCLFSGHFNIYLLGAIVTVLFMSNAFNFSDGLDGLASSLAFWMFCGLFIISNVAFFGIPMLGHKMQHGSQGVLIDLNLILLGSLIPFAYLNVPKAKVFMGDVGSLPIGALFGFELVNIVRLVPQYSVALIVLSIPMILELVPVPLQIFSVKVFKRKLFPFTPIHHAFEKAGWPETSVTALFAVVQLFCVVVSIWISINVRS